MKRFYCTVCKRIKRVRVYPADIQDASSEMPENRVGTCRRHYEQKPARKVKPVVQREWTEANKQQAEGRFNRKALRKAAR
jgi:hypothetical protein